ncbi:hypothetical protein FQA39_LY18895 [Lamprigera yunnana]|nr:hypothetical protein FQA39_LY18895 [Lamprigera yunnana]
MEFDKRFAFAFNDRGGLLQQLEKSRKSIGSISKYQKKQNIIFYFSDSGSTKNKCDDDFEVFTEIYRNLTLKRFYIKVGRCSRRDKIKPDLLHTTPYNSCRICSSKTSDLELEIKPAAYDRAQHRVNMRQHVISGLFSLRSGSALSGYKKENVRGTDSEKQLVAYYVCSEGMSIDKTELFDPPYSE